MNAAWVLTSKLLPFRHIFKPFGDSSKIPGGAVHPLIFLRGAAAPPAPPVPRGRGPSFSPFFIDGRPGNVTDALRERLGDRREELV